MIAPCVILVLGFEVAFGIINCSDIAICVLKIVVLCSVVLEPYDSAQSVVVLDSSAWLYLGENTASVKDIIGRSRVRIPLAS